MSKLFAIEYRVNIVIIADSEEEAVRNGEYEIDNEAGNAHVEYVTEVKTSYDLSLAVWHDKHCLPYGDPKKIHPTHEKMGDLFPQLFGDGKKGE